MEYELWFRVKMPKIGSLLKTWRTSFLIAMITRRMEDAMADVIWNVTEETQEHAVIRWLSCY